MPFSKINIAGERKERVTRPTEGVPNNLSGLTCRVLPGAPLPGPSLGRMFRCSYSDGLSRKDC